MGRVHRISQDLQQLKKILQTSGAETRQPEEDPFFFVSQEGRGAHSCCATPLRMGALPANRVSVFFFPMILGCLCDVSFARHGYPGIMP